MLADVQEGAGAATDTAAADASQSLPAPAAAPAGRNTGSIQKLLLVAAGALALAGLIGSAVYRLGRRRRRKDWLHDERVAWNAAQNPNTPPWLEPRLANGGSIPDLDEARLAAQQPDHSRAMSEGDQTDDRVEQIEEFLARLTRQLQDEIKRPKATRGNVRAES